MKYHNEFQEGNDLGGSDAAPAGNAADSKSAALTESSAAPQANPEPRSNASVLAQGNDTPARAPIPEKFQIKRQDGSLDIEASSTKLAEAYGHLEKRFGTGDAPPKQASDYKIEVPEAFKPHWAPEGDPMLQDFLTGAHGVKLNQAQMDYVMGQYFQIAPALVNGGQKLSNDDCVAELRKDWKTDGAYKQELQTSYQGLLAYAGPDADTLMRDYGNDPRFIRLLNRVGKETLEDSPVNLEGGLSGGAMEIDELMRSKAYTDPKDPKHAQVSARVKGWFEKRAGRG